MVVSAQRRDEAVATARNGLNKARAFGGIAQYFAQAGDRLPQRQIVINKCVLRPDALLQLFTGDDLLGTFQQQPQDFEGLTGEFLAHAGLTQFAGLQVHLK